MIPGVTVTEGQANLDGRTGVAIGRLEEGPAKTRQELIIDPETGLLIGERSVLTQAQEGISGGNSNDLDRNRNVRQQHGTLDRPPTVKPRGSPVHGGRNWHRNHSRG